MGAHTAELRDHGGVEDAGTYLAIAAVALVVLAGTAIRVWALMLVFGGCVVAFVISGAEALAWLWLFVALPALATAASVGWLLRALLGRRGWIPSSVVCVVATTIGGGLLAHRASLDSVPTAVARELPSNSGTLGTFCFDEIPVSERRDARRRTAALVRELGRRPDELVEVEYTLAESPGTRTDERTVRELARETLDWADCASPEAEDLRRALAAAR